MSYNEDYNGDWVGVVIPPKPRKKRTLKESRQLIDNFIKDLEEYKLSDNRAFLHDLSDHLDDEEVEFILEKYDII